MIKKFSAIVLGSGNIGTDLMIKIQRSKILKCQALVGRNPDSKSRLIADKNGVQFSSKGIDFIKDNPKLCDIVFDATSAASHHEHAAILKDLGIFTIDLTPAGIGPMCIPSVNTFEVLSEKNVNMVTCGGQASIPIAYALSQAHDQIDYIEVVSSIASLSAGPATRANLDEYIHTTERGIALFSGAKKVKAILNLNPAQPCIDMQTTIFAKVTRPNLESFKNHLELILAKVRTYIPDYELIVGPLIENDRIVTMVRVRGQGDFLPSYAGNLDIINCAAIAMAEEYVKNSKTAQTGRLSL